MVSLPSTASHEMPYKPPNSLDASSFQTTPLQEPAYLPRSAGNGTTIVKTLKGATDKRSWRWSLFDRAVAGTYDAEGSATSSLAGVSETGSSVELLSHRLQDTVCVVDPSKEHAPTATKPPIIPSDSHHPNGNRMSDTLLTTSTHFAPRWWEEEGEDILRTSNNSNDIRLIRRFKFFQDPIIVSEALSRRRRYQLDSEQIVDILSQGKPSPAPVWDGKGILSAMDSLIDATAIAEKLDCITCSTFCKFSLDTWARYMLGYKDPAVSKFLNDVSNSRNDLAQRFREHQPTAAWKSVEKALLVRHPLAYWMISTSRYDYERLPDPLDALTFILDPVRQLFERRDDGLIPTLKRLSILATRFEDNVVNAIHVDWQRPFPTDFSFLEDINCHNPEILAASFTQMDSDSFGGLSTMDVLEPDPDRPLLERIGVRWDKLCNDVKACVIAECNLANPITEVVMRLMSLRNYNSATAILVGLRAGGVHPDKLSPFWPLIDPANNYATYRALMSEQPGLPFVLSHIKELRLQKQRLRGNIAPQLGAFFQFIQWFGENRDAMEKGEGGPDERPCEEGKILSRADLPSNGTAIPISNLSDPYEYRPRSPQMENASAAVQAKPMKAEAPCGQTEAVDADLNIGRVNAARSTQGATKSLVWDHAKRRRGRPRKHSEIPRVLESKIPKRAKTGCLTCRKRKKKCDEAKPNCINCTKSRYICEGYLPQRKWEAGKKGLGGKSSEGFAEREPALSRTVVECNDTIGDGPGQPEAVETLHGPESCRGADLPETANQKGHPGSLRFILNSEAGTEKPVRGSITSNEWNSQNGRSRPSSSHNSNLAQNCDNLRIPPDVRRLGLAVQPPRRTRPGVALYPPIVAQFTSEACILKDLSQTWAVATLLSHSGEVLQDQLRGKIIDSAHPMSSSNDPVRRAYFYFYLIINEPGKYIVRVNLMQVDSNKPCVKVCEWVDSHAIIVDFEAPDRGSPNLKESAFMQILRDDGQNVPSPPPADHSGLNCHTPSSGSSIDTKRPLTPSQPIPSPSCRTKGWSQVEAQADHLMLSPSGFKYSTVSTGTVYTTNLQENSFYGNPVTDGQDWKARIMLDRPIDIYIASEVACRKRARTAKASQRYRQRRWEEMKQKDIKETMKQHNKMPQT